MRQKALKKQYHLLFVVVTAITMFVFCVIGLYDSYHNTQNNLRKSIYGGWHVAFLHTTQDVYEKISNHVIVKKVGTMDVCGFVDSVSGQKTYTVGYINEAMGAMGGIKVELGDYPKEENELAVEASALSVLGETYDLGDKIEFCYYTYDEKGLKVNHREEFVLTGIVHNYSDVWKNRNDSLIHFFVSPAYGENHASQSLNCYIEVKDAYASNVSELKPLLGGKGVLIKNDYTYDEYAEETIWFREFIKEEIMICMVILFAVFILISLINTMISQRRDSFVLIRSIGGERRYIIKSLAKEIVPVLISGVVWGMVLGILIPAILFRILGLYWDNLSFMIQPKHILLAIGGIIITCFFSCLAGFIGVLRIPMSEGIKYQAVGRNGSGYKWSRRLSLLTTFGIGCVFIGSCYSCYLTYYDYQHYKELYPYDYKYGYMPLYAEADSAIPEEVLEKVENCYGVESVSPFRISPYYEVSWEGMEDSEYVDKLPVLQSVHLPDEKKSLSKVYTCLYEVADGDERTFHEFAEQIDVGEITFEELQNGDKVIIYLPPLYELEQGTITATKDPRYLLQESNLKSWHENTIKNGSIVNINGELGDVKVEVGGIIYKERADKANRICMPLTVIGSEKSNKLLNNIKDYTCIEIYGVENFNQLYTEIEVKKYCPEMIHFQSRREERCVRMCHFCVQILVTSVANVVAIVLLVMIKNGIGDGYREINIKRNRILYILGMPKWKIYSYVMYKEVGMALFSMIFSLCRYGFKGFGLHHGIYQISTSKEYSATILWDMLYESIYINYSFDKIIIVGMIYCFLVVIVLFYIIKKK